MELSRQRITGKLRVLTQFFAAQGVTLVGNLLYGLLCVRLLPTSEYAKFVVLFGVQGTLVVLMDVNFSFSLIPLVGERIDDRKLIADYVASLRQLARWIYGFIAAGAIFVYPWLVKNRGWSFRTVAAMVVTLLVSTWFMRIGAAYGAVLIMRRDRAHWYRGQMISSLGTLALLWLFWAFGALNGFIAILLNVAGIVFVGIFYYYRAERLLEVPGHGSTEKRKAITRLALPNVPQAIFYALQGQISLFLITFFGHTTGVASVGALGRLSQVFAIFLQANPLLVEPYFAKLPQAKVKKSYVLALSLTFAICFSVTLLAYLFPSLFLWVLGPQYRGLNRELLVVIAGGAASMFSGVLWGINSARRFVYWWNVIFGITLTVVAQIGCIILFDMSTVRGVLLLSLGTSFAALLVNLLSGLYGFWKGPRDVEPRASELPESSVESERAMEVYALEYGTGPEHPPSPPALEDAAEGSQLKWDASPNA